MMLLPVLATGATTIQYAQSVIQQFYNYINQRDYPAAYSLWGQDYHTQTRYCNFVDDYVHTLHDDVQVNTPTPLADGTAHYGIGKEQDSRWVFSKASTGNRMQLESRPGRVAHRHRSGNASRTYLL